MAGEQNNAVEIDALQVSIESRSVKNAADNLKQLSSGLTELKKAVSGLNLTKAISGFSDLAAASSKISVANVENISLLAMALSDLSKVGKVTAAIPKGLTNQINNLNQVTQSIPESSIKRLSGLASALNTLGSAKMPKISASVGNQIRNIGTALKTLDDKSYAKIPNLVNALQPLTTLGKSQLTTFINQLAKLPQLASEFDNVNMDKFAASIERLASAMRPLANEMDKVSRGFSALPSKMQSIIRTSAKVDTAVKANKKSWADLFATTNTGYSRLNSLISTGAVLVALHKVKDVLTNSVKESNDYIENLNLFNVAMGEYATEAREYAEQVSEAAGIDPSQWMRNQAVIMDMTKSFGVSSDAAYTMSKALTQLTYDFSSLYNLDIEESATKIQSAIAGEIEPIRRLGKDLSIAKLQLVATNLGILDNVDAMNQADKAMLRTIALLQQSTSAQGDLSRTLEQPANQIRILTAQITLLSRSLGNLFLPIIQKLLPYAIAATKVLRSIIDEFANLAGFELPEFDFSESSSTVTDLGNAFETTYESAKKLSLLSFDQITILGDSSSSLDGSGGGVSDNTNKLIEELERLAKIEDELFNKNLLERTDELTQQFTDWLTKGEGIKAWVQDIKDWFGNIVDFATQIAEQLGLWKIPQAIENLLEKFGIEVDLVDFDLSKATSGKITGGDNLLGLLGGALGLALGIGALTKHPILGGLLAFGLPLLLSGDKFDFDFAEALTGKVDGSDNLLAVLGGALALALGLSSVSNKGVIGNLLKFGIGAAFLLGASELLFNDTTVTGETGEENGLYKAVKSALELGLLGTGLSLVTGGGLKFSFGLGLGIASAYLFWEGSKQDDTASTGEEELNSALIKSLGALLGGVAISSLVGGPLGLKAYGIPLALGMAAVSLFYDGAESFQESGMDSALNSLILDGIGTMLTGVAGSIIGAKLGVGAVAGAGMAMIVTIPLVISFNIAKTMMDSSVTDDSFWAKAKSLYVPSGTLKEQEIKIAQQKAAEEAKKEANIAILHDDSKKYEDAYNEAYQTALQKQLEKLGAPNINISNKVGIFDSKSYVDTLFPLDDIYDALDEKIDEAEKELPTRLELGLRQILFNDTNFYENFANAATKPIRDIVSLFDSEESKKEIKSAASNTGTYIIEGVEQGLSQSSASLSQAVTGNISDPIMIQFSNDMGIKSPSTVMAEKARYLVDGIILGISDKSDELKESITDYTVSPIKSTFITGMNDISDLSLDYGTKIMTNHRNSINIEKPSVLASYNSMFNSITSDFDDFSSDMLDKAQSYVDSLSDILQTNSTSKAPLVTWGTKVGSIRTPAYATGGMPEDGLFFANSSELVGRFSNGRTAVANNEMIIAGIEQGVYKAVTRALQSNSGGSRNIVLDGQVVGKVVDNAIQTERRRSGKLTVTVG